MTIPSSDDLLSEQRAYYAARAPEYDEWWQRRGPHALGAAEHADWDQQVAEVERALDAFGPTGSVLELAGGTGWWTRRLAASAERLTVVDASAETLALNRARVGRGDVRYVTADLFAWQPEETYDVVFFSFWLSHVPRERFGAFWSLVGSCLAPGGRAFFVDSRIDTVVGQRSRRDSWGLGGRPDLQRRRLRDGSQYRVVKVFYEPDELTGLLRREGFSSEVWGTRSFLFGAAAPVPGDHPGASAPPDAIG